VAGVGIVKKKPMFGPKPKAWIVERGTPRETPESYRLEFWDGQEHIACGMDGIGYRDRAEARAVARRIYQFCRNLGARSFDEVFLPHRTTAELEAGAQTRRETLTRLQREIEEMETER
jgi:hypothetical protein